MITWGCSGAIPAAPGMSIRMRTLLLGMEGVMVSVHADGEFIDDALNGEDGAFSAEAGVDDAKVLMLLYPRGCANITRALPAGSGDLDLGSFTPRPAPRRRPALQAAEPHQRG